MSTEAELTCACRRGDCNFSYAGVKTAVLLAINKMPPDGTAAHEQVCTCPHRRFHSLRTLHRQLYDSPAARSHACNLRLAAGMCPVSTSRCVSASINSAMPFVSCTDSCTTHQMPGHMPAKQACILASGDSFSCLHGLARAWPAS